MKMLKRIAITMVAMVAAVASASAQGTLRIGMTASDIPLTTGQADNGGEGMRFTGSTVYDGLINWELGSADKTSGLAPGTTWKSTMGMARTPFGPRTCTVASSTTPKHPSDPTKAPSRS